MPSAIRLSVVVPTYNERESLASLYPELCRELAANAAELVVVDDGSPDGTAAYARSLAGPIPVVVIDRGRRRGLSSAVCDGFAASHGDFIVVMDADGSHPPSAVPVLLHALTEGGAEFALGSRWIPGGSAEGFPLARRAMSDTAAFLARPLVPVHDPMSGFFALRRSLLDRGPLRPIGYKIALEIMVRCRPRPVAEVPIVFRPRAAGQSKLGRGEVGQYLRHLARLYSFRLLGSRTASSTR